MSGEVVKSGRVSGYLPIVGVLRAYDRRWLRGDQLIHHIIDPRRGLPAASPWRTVTVAAPTCVQANIASTASIVRGRPALSWLRRLGVAARLVDSTGQVTTVGSWPDPDGDVR